MENSFQECAFHKELLEKKDTKVSVLEKTPLTAFFITKEYLPNRKFLPLTNSTTNVMGVTEIKYFQHTSEGSVIEIFLTLESYETTDFDES